MTTHIMAVWETSFWLATEKVTRQFCHRASHLDLKQLKCSGQKHLKWTFRSNTWYYFFESSLACEQAFQLGKGREQSPLALRTGYPLLEPVNRLEVLYFSQGKTDLQEKKLATLYVLLIKCFNYMYKVVMHKQFYCKCSLQVHAATKLC